MVNLSLEQRGPGVPGVPTPARAQAQRRWSVGRFAAAANGGGRHAGWLAMVPLLFGAGLLVVSGVIHIHLWDQSYREIPTIGPLFLFQGIAGVVLGVGAVALRRAWATATAFALAVSTIGGFLISINWGLFGFQDTWDAPYASTAFAVEVASAVLLAAAAAVLVARGWRSAAPNRPSAGD